MAGFGAGPFGAGPFGVAAPIERPEGSGAVLVTPPVRLDVVGAPWLADAAITSWQVEREIASSTLPGQIRHRSGLSIGAASVNVTQQGRTVTPWSAEPVQAAGSARLYAATSDGDVELGAWVVDPVSGALTTPELQVDLLEAQYAARRDPAAMPFIGLPALAGFSGPLEADADGIWTVSRIAAQVGYHNVPPDGPSTIVSVPLTGSTAALSRYVGWEGGDLGKWAGPGTGGVRWIDTGGGIGLEAVGSFSGLRGGWIFNSTPQVSNILAAGKPVWITLNMAGTLVIEDDPVTASILPSFRIDVNSTNGRCSIRHGLANGAWSAATVGDWVPNQSPNWPTRVQIKLTRTNNGLTDDAFRWTSTTIEVVSAPGATGTPITATGSAERAAGWDHFQYGTRGAGGTVRMNGLQIASGVSAAQNAEVWKPRNADLALLGGKVGAPWVPPNTDAWTALSDAAAAWGAAAIISPTGRLKILDQHALSGAGNLGRPVDIGREWTDLPWTLDPADTADRLEVTYQAAAFSYPVAADATSPILWNPEEVIRLLPLATVTVRANLDKFAAGIFREWVRSDRTISPPSEMYKSTWEANTFRNGKGTRASSRPFGISMKMTSANRIDLTLTNRTNQQWFLVNPEGEPHLAIRALAVAEFEAEQVITRGLSAEDAKNPLTVDLGTYVQRAEDAAAIADFLWARVNQPMWRADSVRCRLDWTHDIGEVLALTHARSGLTSKALVTKVAYDGKPGEYAQTLSLVLIPPTWDDFDAAWAGKTWAAFDAAWAGKTWTAFDRLPTSTTGGA